MDKMDLWNKASSLRKELESDMTSPIDVFALAYTIKNKNLSIVYYPMGENLSGICIKGINNSVIAVNSSMTMGRQRFSMAHELYHLFFDDDNLTAICAATIGVGCKKEKQADQFASYLLMPPNALSGMIKHLKESGSGKLSIKDIVSLEQYFGVSRQAILYRLLDENEISHNEADKMRQNVIKSAINLGFEDALYRPTPKDKQYGTYGFYIQQAEKALEQGLITSGKYEELLLSAFRADLVYGEECEGGEVLD
ncbi:MAG: ImmA/IrrE family metallo-endopeptidase [Clostridiales bacterium]|jgi:Zn-dependent peptidase ImmA (M78 family)|nr:ImmA/IrrE family metallo-endopeptidase [Clostridiales bacterium]